MKVNRKQKTKNRQQILLKAAKVFRERGFDGIGVADLMSLAGFTHGGFYGHFKSKQDLMVKVCTHCFDEKVLVLDEMKKIFVDHPLESLAKYYLTPDHRDRPGTGCPLATLAIDVVRQSPAVKQAFTEGFDKFVMSLTEMIPGRSKSAKRKKALTTWSTLVGAMILSRALNDPEFSKEILKAVSESI